MSARHDCRHYSTRATPAGDLVQRCRVDANRAAPFACPEHCLFFEPRSIGNAGWGPVTDAGEGERRADGPADTA